MDTDGHGWGKDRGNNPYGISRLLGWGLALMVTLILGAGCRNLTMESKLQRFEYREPHMGTMFTMTLYAPDEATALRAAKAAFKKVIELNEVMTDYDPDSELMQLCRKPVGVPIKVSPDLFEALKISEQAAIWSDGDFDVTIGPIIRLWRQARRQHQLPSAEAIAQAKQSVGYRYLKLDAGHETVTLMTTNMVLDLGGVGKGFAADKALTILRQHGVSRAMVAASGDIAIGDPPPGREGWVLGIGSIDATNSALTAAVVLRNAGISTSGDTEQFVVIDGVRYSHIVDPKTGVGMTNRIGATIIAPRATTTDQLDTTVSLMGVKRGLALVDKLPGVSALIVTLDGDKKKIYQSSRFGKLHVIRLDAQGQPERESTQEKNGH